MRINLSLSKIRIMKSLFLNLFLVLNIWSYGQVADASDFLDFALMDSHDKASYMGSDWIGIDVDRSVEDGNVVEETTYWRFYNEQKYFLTLRNTLNAESGVITYVTKISIGSEQIFNDWMKEWKASGITFVKDPDGVEKWLTPDESFYVIYMEKRKIKDIWVYEISVII